MFTLRFIKRHLPIKSISILLAAYMAVLCCAQNTGAGLIRTENIADSEQRMQDIAALQKVLESKVVAQRLRELGYSEREIIERISRLPDRDLHTLAANVNSLMAGGEAGPGIAIMMVILIVLVIYLAIYGLLHQDEGKDSDKDTPIPRPRHDGSPD